MYRHKTEKNGFGPDKPEKNHIKSKISKTIDYINSTDEETKASEFLNQGNLQAAENIYRRLLTTDKLNYISFCNLASICGMTGRGQEMIKYLRESLKQNNKYSIAYNNLGIALRNQGQLDEAFWLLVPAKIKLVLKDFR